MRHVVELPDTEHVRLVLDHRRFVVVDIQIIWRREECHDTRESSLAALAIHAVANFHQALNSVKRREEERNRKVDVPGILGFMRADDG